MRIGIVVDATCDLPDDYLKRHGIVVLPISLRFGDHWIHDSRDPAATRSFYTSRVDSREDDFAESAPFSPGEIEKLFLDRLVIDYDYVFCLTITSSRSPIYDHAMLASRSILSKYREPRRSAGLPERFGLAVVNSRNLFAGQGIQASEAVRMVQAGLSPSEIGHRMRELGDLTYTYLVPADLHYIYKRASKKGDRSIGWGGYALGTMLDVKPILRCHKDETGPVDKVRGFSAGTERLFANLCQRIEAGLEAPVVCLSYGGDIAKVKAMPGYQKLAKLAESRGVAVLLSTMSKTAAVNVGPGALAVAFAAQPHEFQ